MSVDTFFLACFFFGMLFTVASVLLGWSGSHLAGPDGGHPSLEGHPSDLGPAHSPAPGGDVHPALSGSHVLGLHVPLPLFNVSTSLVFLTWFGAAGYLLSHYAGWPLPVVLAGAIPTGVTGSVLVALFLRKVLAGERVMDPRDYQVAGTIARVSISIPARGTGEVLYSLAGTRRSEAARSLSGRLIPREAEVVIVEYARGIATVQPWDEFVGRRKLDLPEPGTPPAGST